MDPSSSCLEQANEVGLSNFGSQEIRYENCSSEVCVSLQPHLERVTRQNILKSSGVLIGAKYVSVKQNIEQIAVVQDMHFCRYICHIAKSTTKLEKMICAAALFILITCIVLLIYFSIEANIVNEDISTEGKPQNSFYPIPSCPTYLASVKLYTNNTPCFAIKTSRKWFLERKLWLAREFNTTEKLQESIPLVVISHTVSQACYTFKICAGMVKNIQSYYLENYGYDIPYNFLIGNDGRVYEGLGWNTAGAHTLGYNECSIGVAFIGDYREGLPSYTNITELQIQRVHKLLKEGLEHGYLHANFKVVGAKVLRPTLSPGANILNVIEKWPNYDHKNLFRGHTCNEILDFFEKKNVLSNTFP